MNRKVYSSEGGRLCPDCGEPADGCRCAATPAASRGSGRVRVGRETKGRRGKAVTVVSGLPLGAADLADLAKALKARCGAGGTVRDGVIEIQGDHRDTLVTELQSRGYDAKRSGG
ncbi:translation initiation factor Sui1 [bacterium]|nr:translation initiation factor Sui1 [bacterium]